MKKILIPFFIFISVYGWACQCKTFIPINKEICKEYDVVFDGIVDSVSACDEKGFSVAYFTVTELFKGNIKKQVQIHFDCNTECLMSFAEGEEWLIYSLFEKFDYLKISICGHSRKKFAEESLDIYSVSAQRTFEKEAEFLKTTLGAQNFIQENDLNKQQEQVGPHNEQPSAWGKLTLLVISLLIMGIVYYITRKKK